MRTQSVCICAAVLLLAVISAGMSSSLEPPDPPEYRVCFPSIMRAYRDCIQAGELVWWYSGDHCCEGLSEVRLTHPCDTPGLRGCEKDGCFVSPPCPCNRCAPCGDGQCQSQYGENRCSCPSDCELYLEARRYMESIRASNRDMVEDGRTVTGSRRTSAAGSSGYSVISERWAWAQEDEERLLALLLLVSALLLVVLGAVLLVARS
jgi:hypothetical protein